MNKIDGYISIYEQRYETYRHLDKLRWYVFQAGISVIGAIISFHNTDNLVLLGISFILLSTGFIMLKINHGIDRNNIVLKKIADKLGDSDIPDIKSRSKFSSVSWLVGYILTIAGSLILLYEIYLFIHTILISKCSCQ